MRLMNYRLALFTSALVMCTALPVHSAEYKTVPVSVNEAGQLTTVGGTVVPYKEVTLTAQIPGQVETVAGREGEQVKTGQVVVSINDDALQAAKRAANAQLIAAEASLRASITST